MFAVPRSASNPDTVTRFSVSTTNGEPLAAIKPVSLSPDGQQIVYSTGLGFDSVFRVFVRSLDDISSRLLDVPGDARGAAFSPSGESVIFHSRSASAWQEVSLSGGAPVSLAESTGSLGASLGHSGLMVFAPVWASPLRIARSPGDNPVDLTRFDASNGEGAHVHPQLLPGEKAVLFTVWTGAPSWDESLLAVAEVETGDHRIVLRGGAAGRYVASGHLVFWRGGSLMAAPFDLDSLTVTGNEVKVVDDVRMDGGDGSPHFSVSQTGTLVYVSGGLDHFADTFVTNRSGQRTLQLDVSGAAGNPSYSPDGQSIALVMYQGGTFDVGVYDLRRGVPTAISRGGDNSRPTWSPSGDVTFLSNIGGDYSYYSVPPDGSRTPEPLFADDQGFSVFRPSWSADGEHFLYSRGGDGTGFDVWIMSNREEPKPLVVTQANEYQATLSPDGRHIVYTSDELGEREVFLRPFPDLESGRTRVSVAGGHSPIWSRDGQEIFYLSPDGIVSAPVSYSSDDSLEVGVVSTLFEMDGIMRYDAAPDGQGFAIERQPVDTAAAEFNVVLNWFEELERLVPTN